MGYGRVNAKAAVEKASITYFDDLQLFNKSVKINDTDHVLQKHIRDKKEIWLVDQFNFFTLHYVALNLTSSQNNQYAYLLEGFHDDWNYAGTQH